jgi:hypothetical protein
MPDDTTQPYVLGRRFHAASMTAENLQVPAGWPNRGRGAPTPEVLGDVSWAKWPMTRAPVTLPSGAIQVETCVPLTWLRELARRGGEPLDSLLLGTVADG